MFDIKIYMYRFYVPSFTSSQSHRERLARATEQMRSRNLGLPGKQNKTELGQPRSGLLKQLKRAKLGLPDGDYTEDRARTAEGWDTILARRKEQDRRRTAEQHKAMLA